MPDVLDEVERLGFLEERVKDLRRQLDAAEHELTEARRASGIWDQDDVDEPISYWFELSYAHYLTIPRSIMEAMSREWQKRMVDCLRELDDTFDWRPKGAWYWVILKDNRGRFMYDPLFNHDPLNEYRHPDRDYIESIRVEQQTAPTA